MAKRLTDAEFLALMERVQARRERHHKRMAGMHAIAFGLCVVILALKFWQAWSG